MRLGFPMEDLNKKVVTGPDQHLRLGFTTISPFSIEDHRKWTKVFKRMRKRDAPLVGVGGEKVTLGLPWEKSKLYVLPLFLDALSNLELNDQAEYFFTIDANPAPERWSRTGMSKKGAEERRIRVAQCHNRCRQRALDNDSDYLWIIETDLLPPPDAYRRLRALINRHNADAAALPYTWHHISDEGPWNPKTPLLGWRGKYPHMKTIALADILLEKYPARLTTVGFGCTMFSRRVFEKKPFELDLDTPWCTDGAFAKRVEEEGLKVLADNRTFVQHICCRRCFREGYGEYREDWDVQAEVHRALKDRNVTISVAKET